MKGQDNIIPAALIGQHKIVLNRIEVMRHRKKKVSRHTANVTDLSGRRDCFSGWRLQSASDMAVKIPYKTKASASRDSGGSSRGNCGSKDADPHGAAVIRTSAFAHRRIAVVLCQWPDTVTKRRLSAANTSPPYLLPI